MILIFIYIPKIIIMFLIFYEIILLEKVEIIYYFLPLMLIEPLLKFYFFLLLKILDFHISFLKEHYIILQIIDNDKTTNYSHVRIVLKEEKDFEINQKYISLALNKITQWNIVFLIGVQVKIHIHYLNIIFKLFLLILISYVLIKSFILF